MAKMLDMIRSLYAHQAWADSKVFAAISAHEAAAADEALRATLHHIVLVQRGFLALFLKRPFDYAAEMRVPATLAELEHVFRDTHTEEIAFVNLAQDAELTEILEVPYFPGARLAKGEVHLQVVMHSQHHRGQCAARLRALGGTPPTVDFIVWLKDRPAAWS